ncbi:DUF4365 domain-containing protein [Mucilaginibacter polytrichastri]|uniref:DUF4365 domain-containing protein n=1 Tax=Mucilaginibacter polytrichastri TaxID=1302689 RepID=A0A1Q6A2A4_9SPHI|nr:DUF4365 domain-containing protein [Mucilaginibacter polytrichastri]OKS88102.1 hypothetical protein RG47T_3566 [Mucilaginibacter polytrichastri]SFT09711.1 protein of unknown function [Mucilaginibacter polytrichastri]
MNRNPQLPRSSRQETLETDSRNRLAPLFNVELFELRPENLRDKGIDIIGEIKQDNAYTNFRFAIQLKATESVKKQKDGAMSYPIEVNNLQYLLNFGSPAFYILHDHPENQFYIASVAEVYRSLMSKHRPDQLPKTFKVKFIDLLNKAQFDRIYKETFDNGTLLKKLSSHIRMQSQNERPPTGFVIDELQDVYSVEQNIAFIEQVGHHLLNQHALPQIVDIEQRSHPRGKVSAIFNMICGVAYLHQANLFKAVELLKLAYNDRDSLHPEDRSMVAYQFFHAKYLLGLTDVEEFSKVAAEIMANEDAGTFLQLSNLHNQFVASKEPDQGKKLRTYYEGAMRIANKHPGFHDMRVVAYAKVLHAEAILLLHELAKNSLLTMGRKVDAFYDLVEADWLKFDEQFLNQLQALYGYALKHRNFPALSNLMMEKIEWEFAKIYHFHSFCSWNKDTLSIGTEVIEEDRVLLEKFLTDIDKIAETYDRLQQRENQFNCLRCKYEILDFLGNTEEAAQITEEMKTLISTYDMNALRRTYEQLLQGDIKHRKFMADLTERRAMVDRIAKNSGIYEHLYKDIDEEMNRVLKRQPEWSLTELFPLSYPGEKVSNE